MQKIILGIFLITVLSANANGAQDSMASDLKGTIKIDRTWVEGSVDSKTAYALVTWINTTKKTFQIITVQAIALDKKDGKININTRSIFAHDVGPIAPGYEGTLKIPIDIGDSELFKISASVLVAK